MEEGCQKSKRVSYMAKFKRKAAAIFGVDESNV
jgi:hypothetical protein